MIPIPIVDGVSTVFGDIKHMPKYETVPDEFKRHSNPWVQAVSHWFFVGAKAHPGGIEIDGVKYTAKPTVDARAALSAIRAVLGSFEPKHEHKEAACAFMLSEWFDRDKQEAA